MKYYANNKLKAGFSLIELLVAIAVIGVIAAIAIPNIGGVSGAASASEQLRNAQSVANTFAEAMAGGVDLSSCATVAQAITALSNGVSGVSNMSFQLKKTWSTTDETAIEALLTYTPGSAASGSTPAVQPKMSLQRS